MLIINYFEGSVLWGSLCIIMKSDPMEKHVTVNYCSEKQHVFLVTLAFILQKRLL